MNRKLLMALFFSLLIGVLAACGGSDDAGSDDAASDDGDKEVYTVATDNGYVPFEYIDEESGELVGFDIDLVSALAEEVGVEIEFETLEFDGIVAGIGSGRFDIAIAGMTITEEREESIDFTQPYYEAGLILAVQDGNDEIQSIDDVDGKLVTAGIFRGEAETQREAAHRVHHRERACGQRVKGSGDHELAIVVGGEVAKGGDLNIHDV